MPNQLIQSLKKVCLNYEETNPLCQHCQEMLAIHLKQPQASKMTLVFDPQKGIMINDEQIFAQLVKAGRIKIDQCNPLCG